MILCAVQAGRPADREKAARFAEPSFRAVAAEGDEFLLLHDASSIHRAYNVALSEARRRGRGLEAVLLLHADTEIQDSQFRAKVTGAFLDPAVAVLGVCGARGVRGLAWWDVPERVGAVREANRDLHFLEGSLDVDSVDGLLLVLSPWAVQNLRFDEETYGESFHGYDADLCFQARALGRRVRTFPARVQHHTRGGYGDREAWRRCDAAFRRKWGFP